MAVSPTVAQAISRANNTNIGTPPAPTSPIGVEPMTGGNQSITPGQIVFTEYQARVFNQTEAMYKTTGYLGISLFEDSYGLSKRTAEYIVGGGVPLAGGISQINNFATQTYRAVLGIADPTPPPPPPPSDPIVNDTTTTDSNGDPVSPIQPVGPVRGGTGNTISIASTPTSFTPATSIADVNDVGLTDSNVPTTLTMENPAASTPRNNFGPPTPGGGGIIGTPTTSGGGGGKIICNELYRQGFLSEEMWNADEKYGEMMFEKDPKLVIGYQMWARKVVKFMRENPNNTKLAYWVFKPWTEYMGYKMGVVEKPTLRGRFTNWIGTQFSYAVFNLYNGKRLLDKYNYKVFRQENSIPNYKMA